MPNASETVPQEELRVWRMRHDHHRLHRTEANDEHVAAIFLVCLDCKTAYLIDTVEGERG